MAELTRPEVDPPTGPAPDDLVIEDLVVGDGPEATAGSLVSAHYVGVTHDGGEQFDASWDRGDPLEFRLGVGMVIQGWDEGIAGMKVGGRRRLTIPAHKALRRPRRRRRDQARRHAGLRRRPRRRALGAERLGRLGRGHRWSAMTPRRPDAASDARPPYRRSVDGTGDRTRSPTATRTAALPRRRRSPGGESTGTVIVAGLANLAIAVAKLIGGLISHSSAMLSEAAHSVADTVTEVFLFVALKRGREAAGREAPVRLRARDLLLGVHRLAGDVPGRRRILLLPGHHDDHRARAPGRPADLLHRPRGVLRPRGDLVPQGRAAGARSGPQVGGQARRGTCRGRRTPRSRRSPSRTPPRSSASCSPRWASSSSEMTGDPLWDGVAAIAIGLLLLVVAFVLARANKSLLIGQSASPRIEAELQRGDRRPRPRRRRPVPADVGDRAGQDRWSPRRSTSTTASTVADIERIADEAERRLVERHEGVRYVFLDPTRRRRPGPRPGAPPARQLNAQGIPARRWHELAPDMQVEVWSDVVCPWCYIGKRRLESRPRAVPPPRPGRGRLAVLPARPERPRGRDAPDAARAGRQVRHQRRRDARQHGPRRGDRRRARACEYHLADGVSGNTLLAHELLHLAAEHGLRNQLKERLLHAYFEEGRSVFDVDSLVPFAVEVGLDEAEVREALADRRYLAGRARRTARPRRPSARPASRSSSSTGSTAPRAPSRPSCCCRSSSGPGPRRTR